MTWFWFAVAFLFANAAAFAFYFALRLAPRARTFGWLACSVVVALSPCWVPRHARALRFVECVDSVCLLLKIYDAHRQPAAALRLGLGRWAVNLANWFWYVLRRVPRAHRARDWARVAITAPLMLATVALSIRLSRAD